MSLTIEEEKFVKDLFRKHEIGKEIKQKQDIMWEKIRPLKELKDWDKIQEEKSKYRDSIKNLQDELETL